MKSNLRAMMVFASLLVLSFQGEPGDGGGTNPGPGQTSGPGSRPGEPGGGNAPQGDQEGNDADTQSGSEQVTDGEYREAPAEETTVE